MKSRTLLRNLHVTAFVSGYVLITFAGHVNVTVTCL